MLATAIAPYGSLHFQTDVEPLYNESMEVFMQCKAFQLIQSSCSRPEAKSKSFVEGDSNRGTGGTGEIPLGQCTFGVPTERERFVLEKVGGAIFRASFTRVAEWPAGSASELPGDAEVVGGHFVRPWPRL